MTDSFISPTEIQVYDFGPDSCGQKQALTHNAECSVAEDDDDEEQAAQHIRAASATQKRQVRKTEGRSSQTVPQGS